MLESQALCDADGEGNRVVDTGEILWWGDAAGDARTMGSSEHEFIERLNSGRVRLFA